MIETEGGSKCAPRARPLWANWLMELHGAPRSTPGLLDRPFGLAHGMRSPAAIIDECAAGLHDHTGACRNDRRRCSERVCTDHHLKRQAAPRFVRHGVQRVQVHRLVWPKYSSGRPFAATKVAPLSLGPVRMYGSISFGQQIAPAPASRVASTAPAVLQPTRPAPVAPIAHKVPISTDPA